MVIYNKIDWLIEGIQSASKEGIAGESGCFCVWEAGHTCISIFPIHQDLERALQTLKIPGKLLEFCSDQRGQTLYLRQSILIFSTCRIHSNSEFFLSLKLIFFLVCNNTCDFNTSFCSNVKRVTCCHVNRIEILKRLSGSTAVWKNFGMTLGFYRLWNRSGRSACCFMRSEVILIPF